MSSNLANDELPWRGRRGHARDTWDWLNATKSQMAPTCKLELADQAIVGLINALPTLAREQPELYQASANLLLAQSPDKAWQGAMNVRLALVRRAVEGKLTSGLKGDQLALHRRKDTWVGTKTQRGVWTLSDGRDLAAFVKRGLDDRGGFWNTITALPGIIEVETPTKHMGYGAWGEVVKKAHILLDSQHPAVRQAKGEARTWKLAIRRIKRLGARGLYDQATQTVIVDPRHPETLLHELAHWILGHGHLTGHRQGELEVGELLEWFEAESKTSV